MSTENIANRDESEKCRDLAKTFMENYQYAKAAKYFEKSMRLYPLPGVEELKIKAEKLAAEAASGNGTFRDNDENPTGDGGPKTRPPAGPGASTSSNGGGTGTGSAAPTPSSSSKTAAGGAKRAYTAEQESASKKIIALSKKSHYDCLEIPKTATEADIKAAYRKLARKFHPDKNGAPSAEGAFKAIGSASDTLSDPAKRENYDAYGVDENNAGGGDRARMNPFGNFHRGGNGVHEISPDEIFNMFFKQAGGMGGARNFRAHFGQAGGRPATGQGEGQGGVLQSLMQFLPIVMLILMSFSSFGGNTQQQIYSLRKTDTFMVPRETQLNGVSRQIPFYVSPSFHTTYPVYSSTYRQVELAVENEFKQRLAVDCGSEREIKNRKMNKARYGTREMRESAEKLKTPSCDQYSERFTRRS